MNIPFLFAILLLLSAQQLGYAKANFPTTIEIQPTQKSKKDVHIKTKHAKFKPFKNLRTKEERRNLFGLLAILALLASILSLAAFPFSIFGPLLAGAFFIMSCLLAYYGTSKDKVKRLAKLTLIIDLVIALSVMISMLVITVISL